MRKKLTLGGIGLLAFGIAYRRRARRVGSPPPPALRVVDGLASQHRRQRSPSAIRLAVVVYLLTPRFDLNPFHYIWDGATSVAGTVKDFVLSMFSAIMDWTLDWVAKIAGLLWDAVHALQQGATDFADFTKSALGTTVDIIYRKFNEAVRIAQQYTDAAVGVLGAVVDPLQRVMDWFWSVLDAVYNTVHDWVTRNVLWPLQAAIQAVYDWVNTHIIQTVWGMIAAGIHDVTDMVNWLWGTVHDLLAWFLNVARDAVELAWKARWFLLFVITHPFTWWIDYANRIAEQAPTWVLDHIAAAVEDKGSVLEDWAVKLVG